MEKSRVTEILNNCKDKRVAVVGDPMLDTYVWGKVSRISPEAPVPVVQVKKTSFSLGGAANVMRNIVSLRGKVLAFGAAGKDENGKKLLNMMHDDMIDISNIALVDNYITIEKQRIMAESQQLARVDYEEKDSIPSFVHEKIIIEILSLIKNKAVDAIIFEDYAKGLITNEMIRIINNEAKKYHVITALDPHPSRNLKFDHITLMTPNKLEAFTMAGVYNMETSSEPYKDPTIREVAYRIKSGWNVDQLLITLGAQGMILFEKNNEPVHIPTKAKEVFDVTGAGDTVIASYTLALLGGASGREACEVSNHAAGIVVGRIGTSSVTPDELIEAF